MAAEQVLVRAGPPDAPGAERAFGPRRASIYSRTVSNPPDWLMLLAFSAVLGADQIIKRRVLVSLDGGRVVAIGSGVRLGPVRWRTIMVARLGLGPTVIVAAWLAGLALVLLAPRAGLFANPLSQTALAAALAGAASNVLDLLVRKGVVDYVELGRWPAFNLADAAIVSGVILALIAR